jgi:hypothetical protein
VSLSRANISVPPGTDQGYPAFGRDATGVLRPIKVLADGTVVTSGGGGGGGAVTITPNTSLSPGTKTVALAVTPEVLAASTAVAGVLIQALRTNTSFVSIGNAGAQTIVLYPLDWVFLFTNNLDDVYVDVDVNGEGVAFIGYIA